MIEKIIELIDANNQNRLTISKKQPLSRTREVIDKTY